MTFLEKITGSDMTKQYKQFEKRLEQLPADYTLAWEYINSKLAVYSDFTGRNLMTLLEQVLEMLEEMHSLGKTTNDIFGGDINGFCEQLTEGMDSYSVRDKWRRNLNNKINNKLK